MATNTPVSLLSHAAAVIIWVTVSVLLDLPSALLTHLLQLPLTPSMMRPLASSGLADFWGKRYNRTVSAALRYSIYDPLLQLLGCHCHRSICGRVVEQQGLQQQQQQQQGVPGGCSSNGSVGRVTVRSRTCCCLRQQVAEAVATTAAFAASGLMHELCTW